jgi:CO dehydrogenase/acetyl-CoA synthase gamma subunit (corrinoid Fe-S protein)
MAFADLYLDKVDFLKYLNKNDCAQCGVESCKEFIQALRKRAKRPQDCPFLNKNETYAFEVALKISDSWPDVPLLMHPRPSLVGLIELNKPNPESLVLISGNNEYTEQILMTVLGTTTTPFFVVFVDTDGNTVDMAVIYQTMTPERIYMALKETGIEEKLYRKELIIPGFTLPLSKEIELWTRWKVITGPICAAELPLFLSDMWLPPE